MGARMNDVWFGGGDKHGIGRNFERVFSWFSLRFLLYVPNDDVIVASTFEKWLQVEVAFGVW
jgi:hypothetical protein